jgi:alkylation response protein AidB-like acyl-CoA dehydrogenase
VPVPIDGLHRPSRPYSKVGWHASDTHPLTFDDVRVPEENLLGSAGRGYANFLHILDEGRIAISALAVGAAQGCVDESVKYAKEREAVRQADRQEPGHRLQDRPDGGAGARRPHRLLRRAAKMLAGLPFKKEAAIAKLVSSEAAMDNARDACQVHGGYGFMNEYPVARQYRDSKILEIGEGTSEVQLMLVARELGL